MARYIAFLRAINVGGRVVKMARLKSIFEDLGLDDVETFIASGNVKFRSASKSPQALERRIEKVLEAELGYEVATFLRTDAEVTEIARQLPFDAADHASASAFVVGFLAETLPPRARALLKSLETRNDRFVAKGREVYWLCRTRQSESVFSNAVFEKALGLRTTFRNMTTLTRLAAKIS